MWSCRKTPISDIILLAIMTFYSIIMFWFRRQDLYNNSHLTWLQGWGYCFTAVNHQRAIKMLWLQYRGAVMFTRCLCACMRECNLHIHRHKLQLCIFGFHVVFVINTNNRHTKTSLSLCNYDRTDRVPRSKKKKRKVHTHTAQKAVPLHKIAPLLKSSEEPRHDLEKSGGWQGVEVGSASLCH